MRAAVASVLILSSALLGHGQTASTKDAAKPLQFDVVSIKLNHSGKERGILQIAPEGDHLVIANVLMFRIIQFAYDFQRQDLIVGAPEWTRTDRWDIEAKLAPADLPAFHALDFKQQKAMLQPLLAEYCKLQARVAKVDAPIYALTISKTGSKMRVLPLSAIHAARDANSKIKSNWDITIKRGEIHGRAVPIDALLYALGNASLGRPIIDRTGLNDLYDFNLTWTPEDEAGTKSSDTGLSDTQRPSIFTAIQEQLGLRLEATKSSIDAIVVDHIERPIDN